MDTSFITKDYVVNKDLNFIELQNTFKHLKTVKGEFLYNPKKVTEHFCNLKDFDEDCAGIYFLTMGDFVTYVGMSKVSIKDRIYGGNRSTGHVFDKVFDSFRYLNLDHLEDYTIKVLEGVYINLFDSPQNIQTRTGAYKGFLVEDYIKNSEGGKKRYNDFLEKRARFAADQLQKYWNSK